MHPIIKTVLAIIIGVIIAMCVVVLTETVAEKYFPAHSLNPTIEEREEMIRTAPFIAMLIFMIGHGLSSFFGSYVAARIAPDNKNGWLDLPLPLYCFWGHWYYSFLYNIHYGWQLALVPLILFSPSLRYASHPADHYNLCFVQSHLLYFPIKRNHRNPLSPFA
ncbi:MAG: hypothetical protein IPO02_13715 [Bacteroidetes bacterium]|nr:hypothetical protein [Bacteroidota bacterium]